MAAPLLQRLRRKLRWLAGRGWTAQDFAQRYQTNTIDAWGYRGTPVHQRPAQRIVAALPRERFGEALEVGCAEGFLSEVLAAHADHLIACDFSDEAIRRARENCREFPQIEFRVADIRRDFPGDALDLCLFSDVLYYLVPREIDATLKEAGKRVKPGGFLMFINEWGDHYRDLTPPSYVLARLDADANWVRTSFAQFDDGAKYAVAVYRRAEPVC
jgi:predicted TPR repeat methyltransferase